MYYKNIYINDSFIIKNHRCETIFTSHPNTFTEKEIQTLLDKIREKKQTLENDNVKHNDVFASFEDDFDGTIVTLEYTTTETETEHNERIESKKKAIDNVAAFELEKAKQTIEDFGGKVII